MALCASKESECSCHSNTPHCLLTYGYNILPHEEFFPHLYGYPRRLDTGTLSQPHNSLHILLPESKRRTDYWLLYSKWHRKQYCGRDKKCLQNFYQKSDRKRQLWRWSVGRQNSTEMVPVYEDVKSPVVGSCKQSKQFLGSLNESQLPRKAVCTV